MKIKALVLSFLVALLLLGTVVCAAEPDSSLAVNASCMLANSSTLTFQANLKEVPASSDGMVSIYELACFEYDVTPGKTPVATVPANQDISATIPYSGSMLYSKFVLAMNYNGSIVMLSKPQYISNPEMVATNTRPRSSHTFKETQAHDFANLYVGTTTYLARDLRRVTQVMSNGQNPNTTNPMAFILDSHPQNAQAYMLNAANAAGVNYLAETLHKFASNSKSEDWIIGNEVNVRKWNYVAYTDWDTYMREYEQVFRVCYNAIKSANANARVFICIDQNWDRNRAASHAEYYEYMDGKDFLEKFANDISATGNIDWGVAQHPYPVPLTYAKFWDMSGCPDGSYMANQVNSGKMLTFQNLSVLTGFMQQSQMLSPTGSVRHILLSEIGITDAQGADIQAAALCASYVAASTNPLIDGIIYLNANSGSVNTTLTGQAQAVFESMDGANAAAQYEWAKSIIGISDWSQIIK